MGNFELSLISIWITFSPDGRGVGHRIGQRDHTMVSNTFSLNLSDGFQEVALQHNHRHLKDVWDVVQSVDLIGIKTLNARTTI